MFFLKKIISTIISVFYLTFMNVLFITNEFSHKKLSPSGGVGRFYKELSDELFKNGHQVYVLGTNHTKFCVVDKGISFHILNKINFPGGGKLSVFQFFINRFLLTINFISFVKKHKIDVIEINEPIIAYIISFFKGNIPMVLRQHGMQSILSAMYGSKINKIYYFFERRAHFRADIVISVSKYIKEVVHKLYGADLSVDVVYNGIQINNQVLSVKKNNKSLLYVAALTEKKGYLDLVRVFNEINLKDNTVDLVIIGRESEFSFKSLGFTESALNRITYLGYLDYDEMKKYYVASNLFLNFTKGETFGLTTIEAMSNNIPVVISNIGVAEEIVENGISGYIVDLQNTEDVLNKIFKILNDSSLQKKIGQIAGESVKNSFTNEIMYNRTIEIYKKIQN